jgi:hypothetical protein
MGTVMKKGRRAWKEIEEELEKTVIDKTRLCCLIS